MATAKQAPPVLADEEFNKKWDQEGLYQSIKRLHDPRFGEITVVKNNTTNEILFIKEKNASSKQEASNDIRDLKSRIALNHPYLQKLVNAFNLNTIDGLMCRNMISVDWLGNLYDCDFNQMLEMPVESKQTIFNFDFEILKNRAIATENHCYGCTAGSGSSCGGVVT